MNKKIISSFQKMIDVNSPIIYINDYDFARVDQLIAKVIGKKNCIEWNPATGSTNFVNKVSLANITLADFLESKYTIELPKSAPNPEDSFIVLKEIQDFIDEPKVKTLLALMSQRKLYDRKYERTIIIVSSVLNVPREIEKYVSFLEIDVPDQSEIDLLIDQHIEVNKYDKSKFTSEDREKLMPSLKGMSPFEIDRMLDMAMSSNGSLSADDREMILLQKKQMVKKSGVLELIDTPESIDSIGGVEILKNYLKKKSGIYAKLPEAIKFGVSIPKGVFLVGMPGCGKSLCAKATAVQFNNVPLLKMDMSSMMGKYVGESEGNLRKALRIAEAAAPCVLWIDEIEKAFSGVGGNNDIMTRMFGYFLSWMQEKKSAVYVFATANNGDKLPPELKRKGRFDEIFCVNLPNENEREEIFRVHINKKDRSKNQLGIGCQVSTSIDYCRLAKATEGFNGADIESVVNEAIEMCFLEDQDSKQILTTEIIIQIAKSTKSISKSCKSQIEDMEVLFDENDFTNASKKPYWILSKQEREKRKKSKSTKV